MSVDRGNVSLVNYLRCVENVAIVVFCDHGLADIMREVAMSRVVDVNQILSTSKFVDAISHLLWQGEER